MNAGTAAQRHCELPDGRRLAYAEWGRHDGRPVLYCHGFPGSRLEAGLADTAAGELGIRLIAPDRPGFGASTHQPRRRLSHWPDDLAFLADTLDLPRFDLLGVSGGGPYALAAGQHLSERIGRIALVCGLGRLDLEGATEGMAPAAAAGVHFYRQAPALAYRTYAKAIGPLLGRFPAQIFRILVGNACAADRVVLAEAPVRDTILASFREAFRTGGEGPAHELGLFTTAWDIDPTRVGMPVQLWHGEADRTVPVAMGRRHAGQLPRATAHFLPDEGHFSLIVRHMRHILATLIAPTGQLHSIR